MQRLLFFLIELRLDEWDYVRYSIQYLYGQYHERVLDCSHLVDPSIPALRSAIVANVAQSRNFMKDPIPLVWRNLMCLRGSIQNIHLLATVVPPKVRVKATSSRGFARGQLEAFAKRYEGRSSLSRMSKGFDFFEVIASIASDMSAYFTRQNILISGAWIAL